MATILEKLASAKSAKADIKAALTERGRSPSDVLSTYGDEIRAIAATSSALPSTDADLTALSTLSADSTDDSKLTMMNHLIRVVCKMNGKTLPLLMAALLPVMAVCSPSLEVSKARRGLLSNNDQVVTNVTETVRRYAMFVVPLNSGDASSLAMTNSWSGFELKASTNNFDRSKSENARLVFWSQSDAQAGVSYSSDTMRLYVVGGSGKGPGAGDVDLRAYKRVSSTLSLGTSGNSIPRKLVCIVEVAGLVHAPDGKWLREDNDDLVWVYCRTSGDSMEKNSNDCITWSPIAPVKWFSTLPAWADQNVTN